MFVMHTVITQAYGTYNLTPIPNDREVFKTRILLVVCPLLFERSAAYENFLYWESKLGSLAQ